MPAHTNLSLLRFLWVWVNDSQSISIQEITDICIHNLLSLDILIFWYLQNIFQQYKAKSYKHLWHSALQGDPTSPSSRRSVLGVHWKDWCWSWNSSTLATSCEELSHLKRPDAGRDWGQEEKGTTEDEMAGWHHRLDGHEFEQTPGAGDGQGGLACCGSWGHKESDATERLNWTEQIHKEWLPWWLSS